MLNGDRMEPRGGGKRHPHPSRRYGCLRFELMVGRPASSTVRLTMQASGVGVGRASLALPPGNSLHSYLPSLVQHFMIEILSEVIYI